VRREYYFVKLVFVWFFAYLTWLHSNNAQVVTIMVDRILSLKCNIVFEAKTFTIYTKTIIK